MKPIFATFTAHMSKQWFIEFLEMLLDCNKDRKIQITETGLLIAKDSVCGSIGYFFTGTMGTIKEVTRYEWLDELNAHIRKVQNGGR